MNTVRTVRPFPYSHCHCCGTPYPDARWPRRCTACGDQKWHNPTSIGVMLQTVTDGVRIGILTPVRGHGPQLGCKGLVGGYEEAGDDGVEDAAMREYREEIHRNGDARRVNLDMILSRGTGPLYPPGRRQSLTFFVNPIPVHVDEFRDWEPDAETSAIEFSWEPRVLAFPSHTLALAAYFSRYQGIEAPAAYLDQPDVGDVVVEVVHDEDMLHPVYNVVHDQRFLDEGVWLVQLEQQGPHVKVMRDGGRWSAFEGLGDVKPLPMPEREDIERLKTDWLRNPHWDIEGTEGFEEVIPELAAFASMHRARWERESTERVLKRAMELGCSVQLARHMISLEAELSELRTRTGVSGI